jgi:hypothetical protein
MTGLFLVLRACGALLALSLALVALTIGDVEGPIDLFSRGLLAWFFAWVGARAWQRAGAPGF